MKKNIKKKKRAIVKNFQDALKDENEPYSSILKILFIASNFNNVFEKMQTKELRELIVERYHISTSKRDNERYNIFLKLKEELKEYEDVNLDQKIEPQIEPLKSSSDDYKRFESYIKNLEKKGIIDRTERGYCKLSKKFMFSPFKKWCSDFILNSNIDNSETWWNSILITPNISINDFYDKEIIELKCLIHQSLDCYSNIMEFLAKVGYRKANELWEKYIKNIESHSITKFYFWLELIKFHYILGIQSTYYIERMKNEKVQNNKVLTDILTRVDILELFRKESWVEKISNDELFEWNDSFSALVNKAFQNYINSRNKNINKSIKKQISNELIKFDEEFIRIKEKTISSMSEIAYSFLIIFPDFLRKQALVKLGIDNKKADDIDLAIRYMYNRHPFYEKFSDANKRDFEKLQNNKNHIKSDKEFNKLIDRMENEKTNYTGWVKDFERYVEKQKIEKTKEEAKKCFFEETDFFKGCSKQLNILGYKNKYELYTDLRKISNSFYIPISY